MLRMAGKAAFCCAASDEVKEHFYVLKSHLVFMRDVGVGWPHALLLSFNLFHGGLFLPSSVKFLCS